MIFRPFQKRRVSLDSTKMQQNSTRDQFRSLTELSFRSCAEVMSASRS